MNSTERELHRQIMNGVFTMFFFALVFLSLAIVLSVQGQWFFAGWCLLLMFFAFGAAWTTGEDVRRREQGEENDN